MSALSGEHSTALFRFQYLLEGMVALGRAQMYPVWRASHMFTALMTVTGCSYGFAASLHGHCPVLQALVLGRLLDTAAPLSELRVETQ